MCDLFSHLLSGINNFSLQLTKYWTHNQDLNITWKVLYIFGLNFFTDKRVGLNVH